MNYLNGMLELNCKCKHQHANRPCFIFWVWNTCISCDSRNQSTMDQNWSKAICFKLPLSVHPGTKLQPPPPAMHLYGHAAAFPIFNKSTCNTNFCHLPTFHHSRGTQTSLGSVKGQSQRGHILQSMCKTDLAWASNLMVSSVQLKILHLQIMIITFWR